MEVFLAESMAEASRRLAEGGGKPLAGGTDLIIALRKGAVQPEFLVDLSGIRTLKEIRISDGKVKLGSMVTFGDIIRNEQLKSGVPALWEAAKKMGACQIQNRATIGGNLCNAAPAADSVPVLMALSAECILYGTEGERVVPAETFLSGTGKSCLRRGEILEAVTFSIPGPKEGCGFAKLGKRNALAVSTISCAVWIGAENGTVKAVRIFTGSLGPKASRETKTEAFLAGRAIDTLEPDQAAGVLSGEVASRLSGRTSIVYKRVAVKGIIKEALAKAVSCIEDKGGGCK